MNPCLWFLVLQQFGTLQTSLLRHDTEAKGLIATMQLGELEDRKSPSVVYRGKAPVGGLGMKSPRSRSFFCAQYFAFLPYAEMTTINTIT